MINEEIKDLSKLINEKAQLLSQVNKERDLNLLISQLASIKEILSKAILSKKNIISDESFDQMLEELQQEIDKSSKLFDEGITDERSLTSEIRFKIQSLDQRLKSIWQDRYRQMTEDLLKTLKVIKRVDQKPQNIETIIGNIKQLANSWPITDAVITKLEAIIQNGKSIITTLNVDDEIVEFLEKIASNQATINDLSEEVLKWIKTHQLVNSIVLTFKM